MPFASKRQQRWAFASKQPFATRWAKETDFATLKEGEAAMAHGPGGLLATPGLSGKKKRWGTTTKAKQIVGNLFRGDNGKFQAGGASTGKPAATPTRTAKPQKGDVLPAIKPLATPKGGKGSAKPKAKPVDPRQAQRDAERAQDRQQRQEDRTARIARQERMDADRAKREAERLAKQAEPKKGGGGGGGSKEKPDAASKKQQTANETASKVGLKPENVDALRAAAEGSPSQDRALLNSGLLLPNGEASDQGRRALSALERGDVRGYQAAIQDAQARMAREQAAATRAREAQRKRAEAEAKRNAPKVETPKNEPPQGRRLTVFKDATGQMRWLSRTTTAYQDRDGEIISVDALDRDSQRMTATKGFGPLRWWHVGTPDPLSDTAPWGVGLDLGDCDFSTLIGRTRVESGTFKSAQIAEQVAAIADRLEMSPGFFHPIDQPTDRVFTDIRTFERSLVPTRYGRAANLFTGFTVKEHRMDVLEMEKRFKAAITELGLSPEQAQTFGAQLIATEKAAQAQGIAFKSESAPEEITINGVVYTVKAATPPTATTTMPESMAEEVKADMPLELEPEIDLEPELDADVIGNLTTDEFFARLDERLAPVLRLQEMVKSIGDTHAELKTMYGGVTQKDDSRTQELTALKSQLATLQAQIAQISGDQPAVVMPDDLAAALKSAGPEQPTQPGAVVVTDDPNRPWAGLAAKTFPELYYSEAGWQAVKPS